MQPFQVVANLLRTLDRPEAFLQQSKATLAVKRAYLLVFEEPADNPKELTQWAQPQVMGGLRALVQETIQDLIPSNPSLSTSQGDSEGNADLQSNSEFDAEGQLKLDFDSDNEYLEGESLYTLAFHTGRAQVRRYFCRTRPTRGYRSPHGVRQQRRPKDRDARMDRSVPELLSRTCCWKCLRPGHISKGCRNSPTAHKAQR